MSIALGKCSTGGFLKAIRRSCGGVIREIDPSWGAQRVKGLSIFAIVKDMFSKLAPGRDRRNVETSLIEEFIYPKYGPGQLWEITAQEIEAMGGEIRKNSKVTGIRTREGAVTAVQVQSVDGSVEEVEGDLFLSSMPLKDLVEGMGDSAPEKIRTIASGLDRKSVV